MQMIVRNTTLQKKLRTLNFFETKWLVVLHNFLPSSADCIQCPCGGLRIIPHPGPKLVSSWNDFKAAVQEYKKKHISKQNSETFCTYSSH